MLAGTAQALPLPDASVDVVHARWAYFFGPGCEPGLRELDRVVRRGGTAFVDRQRRDSRQTFGAWFRRGYPTDRRRRGRALLVRARLERRSRSTSTGASTTRADLEAVVRIEFAPEVADEVLAEHEGTEVDYAVNLWWRQR